MGRRLAAAVHVTHPETNEPLILQPGDEPDETVAAVITNPAAWEPDEDADGEDGDGDAGAKTDTETKPRSRTRKQADE
ncbi:hypothetical protein GCM10014715_39620 [Streptomyces spiralis]|uniref:Uncharacterized protein n=1 Tax=Streptomyces spiralis TaxID=66376 RepID=A0A919DUE0_9ACTN|nr:hypothetical protein [Streptomyces spiralis]GHE80287.1 hypothetical protein GCM10014715_39620 [Streptomyces spiralis]